MWSFPPFLHLLGMEQPQKGFVEGQETEEPSVETKT